MKNNPAKQNIINISKKLFYYQGYEKTSLSQIAKEATMSKSNIFNYYKNKSEIMYYVYEQFYLYLFKLSQDNLINMSPISVQLFFIIIQHDMFLYDDNFSELYCETAKEIMIEEIIFKFAYPTYIEVVNKYMPGKFDKETLELNFYTIYVTSTDFLIKWKTGLTTISFDKIKKNSLDLCTKLINIDNAVLETRIKEAEILAQQFDYNKLSEFWYKNI